MMRSVKGDAGSWGDANKYVTIFNLTKTGEVHNKGNGSNFYIYVMNLYLNYLLQASFVSTKTLHLVLPLHN